MDETTCEICGKLKAHGPQGPGHFFAGFPGGGAVLLCAVAVAMSEQSIAKGKVTQVVPLRITSVTSRGVLA